MSHAPIQFLSNTPPPIDDFDADKDEIEDVNFSNFNNFEDNNSNIQPVEETSEFQDELKEQQVFPQQLYFRSDSPPSLDLEETSGSSSSTANPTKLENPVNLNQDSIDPVLEESKEIEIKEKISEFSESFIENVELSEIPELPDLTEEENDSEIFKSERIMEDESITENNQKINEKPETPEIQGEILGKNELDKENDDFCEFVDFNSVDPVPPADNFDDFADFDEIIPVHRNIESEIFTNLPDDDHLETEEINFHANFDAFEQADPKELETRQEFSAFSQKPIEILDEQDDDDDFGEFSDFTSATFDTQPAPPPAQVQQEQKTEESFSQAKLEFTDIVNILNELFPTFQSEAVDECVNESEKMFPMAELNDVDSMKALEYQYSSSKTSESIIVSLGIDNRNILLGAHWNCQMPRFAANLSLSPLEPTRNAMNTILEPTKAVQSTKSDIKVKPIEVKKVAEPNYTETREVSVEWEKPVVGHSPESSIQEDYQNVPSSQSVDAKSLESPEDISPEIPQVTPEVPVTNIDLNYLEYIKPAPKYPETSIDNNCSATSTVQRKSEFDETKIVQSNKVDPFMNVNLRTIKLPETHIFTPLKGSSTISQEVPIHNEEFLTVGESRVFPLNKVMVKEYHDLEYNLDKAAYDYQYFGPGPFKEPQTAATESSTFVSSILEPEKVDNAKKPVELISVFNNIESPAETGQNATINDLLEAKTDDDDFNDFQAAPISLPTVGSVGLLPSKAPAPLPIEPINISSLPLSNSNFVEPSSKTSSKSKNLIESEDDEWSDFVSSLPPVPQPTTSINSIIVKNPLETQVKKAEISSNDDEFGDFVTAQPVSSTKINSNRQTSTSFLNNGPKFNSWYQPSIPPASNSFPNFNQFQSFATKDHNHAAVPSSVNITNNFAYDGGILKAHNASSKYPNYNNQLQKDKLNSSNSSVGNNISVLPDLHYSMPSNFISSSPHNTSSNFLKK